MSELSDITNPVEVERKWLLKKDPTPFIMARKEESNGLGFLELNIEQSYLSFEPEIRLRKAVDMDGKTLYCKQGLKSNGGISRKELEFKIDESIYTDLLANYVDIRGIIRKHYYTFSVDEGVMKNYEGNKRVLISQTSPHLQFYYEISKVDNSWWYMEIEFPCEAIADEFELDTCVANAIGAYEVTDIPAFKMKNYAKARIEKIITNTHKQLYANHGIIL